MIDTTVLKTFSEIALLFTAFIIIFTFKGFFKSLVAKLVGDIGQFIGDLLPCW